MNPQGERGPVVQIRVSARHTAVSDRDRSIITEKIDRLSKFLPGMERGEVHFSEERNPRIADKEVCEVTLFGHGHTVRCKANGPDHVTATDMAIEKLENKLHKLKTKLNRKPHHRDAARAVKAQVPGEVIEELVAANGSGAGHEADLVEYEADLAPSMDGSVPEYEIVRSKRVEKLLLSPLEAALRMDLVSHDFYFFTNADTGEPAVVYRRNDGGIGLIDQTE